MEELKERRIVLLGKTGSGKSSLGNTILGDSLLKVKVSPESETSWCQSESKTVDGIRTTVIDTPGFFDTKMPEEKLKCEIVKCIKECAPGPHAFLIVLQVGRYSPQEKDLINKILEYFSEEALKHAVIVFTRGDELPEGVKIKDFVSKSKALSDLVKMCDNRCHVFDNKYWNNNNSDDYRNNQYQVNQLLNTVDEMKSSGGCYTNKILQAVSKNQWDIKTLLKIFAGVATGVLLGALLGAGLGAILGAKICLYNVAIGSVIGGITGSGAVGYNYIKNNGSCNQTMDNVIKSSI